MKKELTFKDKVFCYTMTDKSIWGGPDAPASPGRLTFHGYIGEIEGIRKMMDGSVFYTVRAKQLNLHSGEYSVNPLPKTFEVQDKDCFSDISELKEEIYKYIDMVDKVFKTL